MKIGFVIPARLKSTRLPRKNLLYLGEQTALGWAIDRAKKSKIIDEVVVATTPLIEDSEITKICQEKQIRYFMGDPVDVLKRYRDTTRFFNFDFIVNMTPDNTLFSIYLIDLMCNEIRKNPNVDFFRFKDAMLGTGIYALRREALETICEFKEILDTEIWGPLFQEEYFNILDIELPEYLKGSFRLTMDTPSDYKVIRKIYRDLKITRDNLVELEEVIDYLNTHPEVAKANSEVAQVIVNNEEINKIKNYYKKNKERFYEIKEKFYRKGV